ncbi:MAG: hypothetical protein KDC52_02355 [Ignavibacteriae bacterium]|nr:hypothetical protein [Ignavibacteriota bacterium]
MYTVVWEFNIFSAITALIAILSLVYNVIITDKKSKTKLSEKYYFLKSEFAQNKLNLEIMNHHLHSWQNSNKQQVLNDPHFRTRCSDGIESNNTFLTRLKNFSEDLEKGKSKFKKLLEIESNFRELKRAIEHNDGLYNETKDVFRNKH